MESINIIVDDQDSHKFDEPHDAFLDDDAESETTAILKHKYRKVIEMKILFLPKIINLMTLNPFQILLLPKENH